MPLFIPWFNRPATTPSAAPDQSAASADDDDDDEWTVVSLEGGKLVAVPADTQQGPPPPGRVRAQNPPVWATTSAAPPPLTPAPAAPRRTFAQAAAAAAPPSPGEVVYIPADAAAELYDYDDGVERDSEGEGDGEGDFALALALAGGASDLEADRILARALRGREDRQAAPSDPGRALSPDVVAYTEPRGEGWDAYDVRLPTRRARVLKIYRYPMRIQRGNWYDNALTLNVGPRMAQRR